VNKAVEILAVASERAVKKGAKLVVEISYYDLCVI